MPHYLLTARRTLLGGAGEHNSHQNTDLCVMELTEEQFQQLKWPRNRSVLPTDSCCLAMLTSFHNTYTGWDLFLEEVPLYANADAFIEQMRRVEMRSKKAS